MLGSARMILRCGMGSSRHAQSILRDPANVGDCTRHFFYVRGLIAQPVGVAMLGQLRRSVSRQFTAVALIVALILQGMAVAAASGRLAAQAADADTNWLGFEICHHSGLTEAGGNTDVGDAATPGSAPEDSGAHCIFCLAGSGHALEALLPSADFHVIIQAITPWPFTVWRLPAPTVNASARPRGPPPAA
jgi:hypothetical protein